jgi:fatty acid desaturase
VFSLAQILIDTFKGLYNTAFMKFVVAILVTLLLNGLCDGGLGVVSWIIVFIPFILMTFVVAMLLYIFGMNAAIGSATPDKPQTQVKAKNPPLAEKTYLNFFPTRSSSPAYESFSA